MMAGQARHDVAFGQLEDAHKRASFFLRDIAETRRNLHKVSTIPLSRLRQSHCAFAMTVQSYLRGAHSQRLAQTVIKSSNKKANAIIKKRNAKIG